MKRRGRRGQAIVEYIIIVAIVAVAAIAIVGIFGHRIRTLVGGAAADLGADSGDVTNSVGEKDGKEILKGADADGIKVGE